MKKFLIILSLFVMNTQMVMGTEPCGCEISTGVNTQTTYGYNVGDGLDCCEAFAGPTGTYLNEVWNPNTEDWEPVSGGPMEGSGAQAACCPVG